MDPVLRVVLASHNPGKLQEFRSLLAELPVEFSTVQQVLGVPLEVDEPFDTFEQNALTKAQAASAATGLCAVADDSGLEVDALGGRPGVRSARFAGEGATASQNNAALLRALEGETARTARFRCVLALVAPWSTTPQFAHGSCSGRIALQATGTGGFGYDPLFIVDGFGGKTFAELEPSEKNRVSHRGQAVRALAPILLELANARLSFAGRQR